MSLVYIANIRGFVKHNNNNKVHNGKNYTTYETEVDFRSATPFQSFEEAQAFIGNSYPDHNYFTFLSPLPLRNGACHNDMFVIGSRFGFIVDRGFDRQGDDGKVRKVASTTYNVRRATIFKSFEEADNFMRKSTSACLYYAILGIRYQ